MVAADVSMVVHMHASNMCERCAYGVKPSCIHVLIDLF